MKLTNRNGTITGMTSINELIRLEEDRQKNTLMMIPSENYTYKEVREAVGSYLIHKYSEGYPGKRYYQGNIFVDQIEVNAINLAREIFNVSYANVQPYSGSPANSEVYMGLLKPGESILGMSLSSGGHLTHGHPKITFSGVYFNSIQYGVTDNGEINYEEVESLAIKYKPKIIVCGTTAYPKILNWEKFSNIAEKIDACLMADISHIAGLVAGGSHPSPSPFVDIITTTTHKTLRGPRGAMILITEKGIKKDPGLPKKIDRAVFPGMQGGPHNNTTAGIAIALEKAKMPEFKDYAKNVVENAKVLSKELINEGFILVGGRTENHLMLIDLRSNSISGKEGAINLEKAGIVVNYNSIPNDPNPPMNPSGIRLGTPALTSRGMGANEMKLIAKLIADVLIRKTNYEVVNQKVVELCSSFKVE